MTDLSELRSVRVYFDGGFHYARKGRQAWAEFGFAIYRTDATDYTQYLNAASVPSEPGAAIGAWDQDLLSLSDRLRVHLSAHRSARGAQVYDLVAAQGGLLHLKVNDFHGTAFMRTDGEAVIRYMNGDDTAWNLDINGENVAAVLRDRITNLSDKVGVVVWERVPNRENWADPVYKGLRRERIEIWKKHPPGAV